VTLLSTYTNFNYFISWFEWLTLQQVSHLFNLPQY